MGNRGISLIEVLMAVSIMGILVVSTVFLYQDWIGKYRVERAIRELYSDLMTSRVIAMHNNIEHIAVLNDNSYSIVEDTDLSGNLNAGDRVLASFPKALEYKLCRNGSGNKVFFNRRGLVSPCRTVWFSTSSEPDYDCMKIFTTRIILGRYKNNECEAK